MISSRYPWEKRVLKAGRWSRSKVSKPEFQKDGSNRTQDSVIEPEARTVVIKDGSPSESLGELENKQTNKTVSEPYHQRV